MQRSPPDLELWLKRQRSGLLTPWSEQGVRFLEHDEEPEMVDTSYLDEDDLADPGIRANVQAMTETNERVRWAAEAEARQRSGTGRRSMAARSWWCHSTPKASTWWCPGETSPRHCALRSPSLTTTSSRPSQAELASLLPRPRQVSRRRSSRRARSPNCRAPWSRGQASFVTRGTGRCAKQIPHSRRAPTMPANQPTTRRKTRHLLAVRRAGIQRSTGCRRI